jgi:MarR family transcriptional regulator, organic hydroperoxide resistance regulator
VLDLPRPRRSAAEDAKRSHGAGSGAYVLPLTVSCRALLDNGSDRRFRALVNDLLTIASRMETVRAHLGARIGISGPQYSVLVAVAHLEGARGVSVGTLAQALHVSSAFVASETGRLARRKLLFKGPNPDDRRGVLINLAPAGRLKIDRIGAELRAINDLFFGGLDAGAFATLSAAAGALVRGSEKAVRYVDAVEGGPTAVLRASS